MAEGVLGLGGGGSAALSNDVIDKLKAAESKSKVEPIEKNIETWDEEVIKIAEIEAKVAELLVFTKGLDLFNSTPNAFEQMSASTTGDGALFDALDVGSLTAGTLNVNFTQLAQKDVYDTTAVTDANKDLQVSGGNDAGDMIVLSQSGRPVYQSDFVIADSSDIVDPLGGTINIDGTDFTVTATMTYAELSTLINDDANFNANISNGRLSITNNDKTSTLAITETLGTAPIGLSLGEKFSTEGKTYTELTAEITYNGNYTASMEQVGTDSNKLVLKSKEPGLDNAITITEVGVTLGFTQQLTAQNMKGTIDNVDYDVSTNTVVTQGLSVTAVKINEPTTVTIMEDHSQITNVVEEMISKYNDLVDMIDDESFSADSPIYDIGSLNLMMASIKDIFFADYNTVDGDTSTDQNIFNAGFGLDKSGHMTLDTTIFAEALSTDFDGIKALIIGAAEDKGLGTTLKEYIDELTGYDGLLTNYDDNLAERKVDLEAEKEAAVADLNEKYQLMSLQFASYGTAIAQMEASFGGLKMMIAQSTASG